MRLPIRTFSALTLFTGAALLAAWRPVGDPLSLGTGSKLTFDGKSTVRDWSCTAMAIDATIDATGPAAVTDVLKGAKGVRAATLVFPAMKLDCANGTMNGHMRKALNAEKHEAITFALSGYELEPGTPVKGTLRGDLMINGVTQPVTLAAEFTAAGPALRVTGSYALKMTDWQVVPPKLMLGALKVNEMVTVHFDLQLNP